MNILSEATSLQVTLALKQSSMQLLELLTRFVPVRESLFLHLLPSELARFAASIRLHLTKDEREKYLIPIRQLGKYESVARSYVADGYHAFIIGKDLIELMDELDLTCNYIS